MMMLLMISMCRKFAKISDDRLPTNVWNGSQWKLVQEIIIAPPFGVQSIWFGRAVVLSTTYKQTLAISELKFREDYYHVELLATDWYMKVYVLPH